MKNNSKKSIEKTSLVGRIIILILTLIMIYSGYKIITWLNENNKNNELKEQVQQEVRIDSAKDISDNDKYQVNVSELQKTNIDIVGWIKVWGTDIEFPVVQTTDNEYYLTHSMDKTYNSAGWIFADYTNKLDGTDKNIVIYGHNRRDNSMFGTLKNVLNKEWYDNENNYFIPFIQEGQSTIYEVFSVYQIENEDYYITTNFSSIEEYQTFIDTIKSRSVKNFGIDVTTSDNILTLSTCADNNKYRVVLHARKIK